MITNEPMEIRLYGAEGSNCTDRVRWAADYKRLDYLWLDTEGAGEHLAHFRKISPFGAVPVVEFDGVAITESMAIVEAFDELSPERSLLPGTSLERARIREICEVVNSSIHPAQSGSVAAHYLPALAKHERKALRVRWIHDRLAALEASGKLWRESAFAVAAEFTAADIFVAAIFWKAREMGLLQSELPSFQRHLDHLRAIPDVAAACPFFR